MEDYTHDYTKSDIGRLHVSKKYGRRGLIAIENCVELAVNGLEAASVLKEAKKEKRLQDWGEKVLHGQYLGQTKKVRSEQIWVRLQNGDLKRETESLIVAAQNQSIRTNLVKAKIDKIQKDGL